MSSGGNETTTQTTQPYAPAEPFLKDILGEAQNVYRSGVGRQFFPSSTVVPFADQTQQALNLQQAQALEQMQPSTLQGQAATTLGNLASGTASNQFLDQVRQGITSDVMGNVQTQFGGMGRTGTSPAAQQAVARGITQAYTPFATGLQQQERDRQLKAAQQLSPLQDQMDLRRTSAVTSLGGVGAAYEDLARRQLEDQFARFQFGQQAPMQQLTDYAGLITPIASGLPVQMTSQPGVSPIQGGFGGAVAGSALGPFGAAAGGMGLILCQWAKAIGATVIGTVSTKAKAELAKEAGCDYPIIRSCENFVKVVKEVTNGEGCNVVYEAIGKDTLQQSLDSLKPMGMCAAYGHVSGPPDPIDVIQDLGRRGSLFITRPAIMHYLATRNDLEWAANDLFNAISKGTIKSNVNYEFQLKDAVKAHEAIESGKTQGSIILLP